MALEMSLQPHLLSARLRVQARSLQMQQAPYEQLSHESLQSAPKQRSMQMPPQMRLPPPEQRPLRQSMKKMCAHAPSARSEPDADIESTAMQCRSDAPARDSSLNISSQSY
ncbi:hypothetical protein WM28_12485 [Burkholderia ubonensis]|nr:hypothetical protein WJ60_09145 [Burkholderia ubonensis]KWD54319.1 hypothetical protein WL67_14595 [Burkholderia ubonensis]KWO51449.1 hypothetical protein WM28_12485 [Burkholderia ubonensis]